MAKQHRALRTLAPLVFAALLMLGAWAWLNAYTRHNAKAVVPALKGLTFDEAKKMLAERGLLIEVSDTVFNDDAPKSTILDQNPPAERTVKPDRTVYVVMNSDQPKMLNMPALVNLSKRQALSVLEIIGIRVREMQYRPDPCVDCIVAQLYKGAPIAPEQRIRRGESIVLVLGSGEGGGRVKVMDVRGLAYNELKEALLHASLNLGVVVECKGCNTKADSTFARVVRQSPEPYATNTIGMGGMIDVWLTTDTAGLRPRINWKDSLNQRTDTNEIVP